MRKAVKAAIIAITAMAPTTIPAIAPPLRLDELDELDELDAVGTVAFWFGELDPATEVAAVMRGGTVWEKILSRSLLCQPPNGTLSKQQVSI
ncbi:MAG: hypothetical protein Q9170_002732 [Blastenia crenularia]